jgi:hypothetical protein
MIYFLNTDDMKKGLLFLAACLVLAARGTGQERRFDLEIGAGSRYEVRDRHGERHKVGGPMLFAEVTYYLRELPVGVGVHVRASKEDLPALLLLGLPSGETLLFGDYHFFRGRAVNLYIGLGAGTGVEAYAGWSSSRGFEWGAGIAASVVPRAGVRLFRCFSISGDYELSTNGERVFNLKAGYIF